ncbi:MAG: UvrD-helicase domain-containing protein [Bacilli bacterium]|nr:UvrD-helicase domain-containing protein [Bacilli bacterium]
MNWTDNQKEAIESRNQKIVVSAAAGSGKTAVLSERVIDYLLKGGNIKKLLIVTFTTAAANEMKERIKVKINKLLDQSSSEHLKEQLLDIEEAKIMTMDAFYNFIVKNNFYLLNIKPDFKIINEHEYYLIKTNLATQIINSNLENKNNIEDLLDNFSTFKSAETVEQLIINLSDFVSKMPFPMQQLDNMISSYKTGDFNNNIWSSLFYDEMLLFFSELLKLYEECHEEILLDDVLSIKVAPLLTEEINTITKINELLSKQNYVDIRNLINHLEFSRFPNIKGYADEYIIIKIKKIRDYFKKNIKNISLTLTKYSQEDINDSLQKQAYLLSILIDLTKTFKLELEKIRKQKNFLGFEDVPHLVITLLVENYDFDKQTFNKTSYAKELQEQFDEILIDEFQDTNYLQHLIFKAISKDENNLFIVGDIKQSIYGFRSARAEIFSHEKENITSSKVINLSQNFRSQKEIIDFCNYLFSKTMSKQIGSINYDNNEKLNLGITQKRNQNIIELHLLTKDEESEDEFKNVEREAYYTANKIRQLFNEKFQVFDNKTNSYRLLKQSDIAILLRSVNPDANIFKNILEKNRFDVYTETTTTYFDNYEVKLIIAILKIINNPLDELSLVAILRSPIFNFTDEMLVSLREKSTSNLYYNLLTNKDSKTVYFLKEFKSWQQYHQKHSIYELLSYIYQTTNIFKHFNDLDNVTNRHKNIIKMLNHAYNFTKEQSHQLSKFINYIEELQASKLSLEGINPPNDNDSILITTIHKSKGLEFPIVIMPHLNKKFNFTDINDSFILDFDYLCSFKIRDFNNYTVKSNIILELLKKYKLNRLLSEELRILYVALTRAKEKLIMISFVNNLESKCLNMASLIGNESTINKSYLKTATSYIDFILPVIMQNQVGKKLRDDYNIDLKQNSDNLPLILCITSNSDYLINNHLSSNKSNRDIKKILINLQNKYQFNYTLTKNQYHVTELEHEENYHKPKFLNNNLGMTVGTDYHKIMEHIPFIKYTNREEVVKEIANLQNIADINHLDIDKIYSFFNCNLYKELINGKFYKEYAIYFSINKDNNDDILIDGIIDLLCILPNKAIIIDYKTDNINESDIINNYKKQLDLYEIGIKQIYNIFVEKYIYSFYLKKMIKI